MAPNIKVIIAGGGVGGLLTAMLLERANIDYVVLERASEYKRLGAALTLSCQIVRLFDQLGLLEELILEARLVKAMTFYNQKLDLIGRTPLDHFKDRYGYASIGMARPDFIEFLLRHVNKEKLLWSKKILSTEQNAEGVSVTCADGSVYKGDILIGADGAYSTVREHMYRQMQAEGVTVPEADLLPLRFEMYCNVGVAYGLDPAKYSCFDSKWVELDGTLASDEPFTIWVLPVNKGGIAWVAGGKRLQPKIDDHVQERETDWAIRTQEDLSEQLRDIKLPVGGTLGDLVDHTDPQAISRVLLEDKLFTTWYHGRTVLIGDACHKLLPFGGQGATQAMLDGINLVNMLQALPENKPEKIQQGFEAHRKARFPSAEGAFNSSVMAGKLSAERGFVADVSRALTLKYMPQFLVDYAMDILHRDRPIMNFLPSPPVLGSVPANPKVYAFPEEGAAATAV
ncbi:hypothetical protein DFQ27_007670 [Actinomortierella ambigua]|uniref:FAD-binding domain-containing protein n=1 Tax=Actinomortierella ambigua TaxID=1343610 RepID=A0A9P6QHG0_9FUNG|nr:hypothetical protein DFQ26_004305 [Actinomortierella ambigua]KAG0268041.1 hypothetical protein DFQ27_007670 [Actinomortierella ambigua]